jgi:hypothetical protein
MQRKYGKIVGHWKTEKKRWMVRRRRSKRRRRRRRDYDVDNNRRIILSWVLGR